MNLKAKLVVSVLLGVLAVGCGKKDDNDSVNGAGGEPGAQSGDLANLALSQAWCGTQGSSTFGVKFSSDGKALPKVRVGGFTQPLFPTAVDWKVDGEKIMFSANGTTLPTDYLQVSSDRKAFLLKGNMVGTLGADAVQMGTCTSSEVSHFGF